MPDRSIAVIIPAHNEERHLPACLDAVEAARARYSGALETVVVCNRCTDATEAIARAYGARTIRDESRCLATIRNAGVAASDAEVIVTCDADSRLHPATFGLVVEALEGGAVGGGVDVRFDRRSLGIRCTELLLDLMVRITGVPCGAFWTTRAAFDAIGGFDERLPMSEDLDFGKRLRRWGRARALDYRRLAGAPLLTSARKFDAYGDWSFFRMMVFDALRIRRSLRGDDTDFVDEYFYDFNDRVRRE
ncbi:MAG: glycosyltransferase [Myxococcales bacterium]|nr:glycosyltransferase [Myxococcales bacterium]